MNIQNAMSCKKGGFIAIRHNDLGDLTANLLTEVCKDVDIEPQLLPVTGETSNNRNANTSNEARVYMKSRGFWVRGQQVFFDVRLFDPNTNRYFHKALLQCYIQNEKDNKRQYNERVLDLTMEISPLLYSQFMGYRKRECSTFYNRLAKKIAKKRELHQSIVAIWTGTKISFALLKSALLCLRGSRSLSRSVCFVGDNTEVAHEVAKN